MLVAMLSATIFPAALRASPHLFVCIPAGSADGRRPEETQGVRARPVQRDGLLWVSVHHIKVHGRHLDTQWVHSVRHCVCLPGPVVGEFPAQNDVNLAPAPSLPQVMIMFCIHAFIKLTAEWTRLDVPLSPPPCSPRWFRTWRSSRGACLSSPWSSLTSTSWPPNCERGRQVDTRRGGRPCCVSHLTPPPPPIRKTFIWLSLH